MNYKRGSYPLEKIKGLLMNWGELECAEEEPMVILRCDMELAVGRLSVEGQKIANTVAMLGQEAFDRQVVSHDEFEAVTKRLFVILNREGVVAWWSKEGRGQ